MKASIKDNILTIEMPLGDGKRSKSGKSILMFTTKGFVKIPDSNIQISVNVIKGK